MVEIKLPKCLLVLTEAELLSLLAHDRDLWKQALERGKAAMRQRQAEARKPKHIGEVLPVVLERLERRAERRAGNERERVVGHDGQQGRSCQAPARGRA